MINNQTEHFVTTYNRVFGTNLTSAQIIKVPVRDIPGLNISVDKEHAVFNNSNYWKTLSPLNDSASVIRRLRKEFGYEIFLFTHRPWPIYDVIKRNVLKKNYPASSFLEKSNLLVALISGIKNLAWNRKHWFNDLSSITKVWLKVNEYSYDKLVIEKGNEYSVYYRPLVLIKRYFLRYRNRFQMSRSRQIKIFVEDRMENAIKLASICDLVFLIDAPYNQVLPAGYSAIPNNVVRVNDWKQILEWFKFNS